MKPGGLAPHPRLCFDSSAPRAREQQPNGAWARANAVVARRAENYVADRSHDELLATHNAHLVRARRMQGRVLTLAARWLQTGDARFRDAVVEHIDAIGNWEYWSWIAWRNEDSRPDAIFDLSYGENSATLAFAYDLLVDDLTAHERARIVDIATHRAVEPFLRIMERGEAWWFGKPNSNWNPVCAGGAGLLAMAFADDVPATAEIRGQVESSLLPFFRALEESDGGCPEGLGYWNYGMRYAFMYLLSADRSWGEKHPLLWTDTVRKTLWFPLDFCPYGQPCSFGDGNHWVPLPAHRAAAAHVGESGVVDALDTYVSQADLESDYQHWPTAAELLLWPVGDTTATTAEANGNGPESPAMQVYDGLGWVRIADRWPDPRFYLSVRGGPADVPHGHLDLLSFHAMVDDERLIENLTPHEYLDTTFGPRRFELFEMTPQSKNVPLVNGVGITQSASVVPEPIEFDTAVGVRLDATTAIGHARQNQPLASYLGRLFLLIDGQIGLIVDRIRLEHPGRVETRLHTRAGVELVASGVQLTGERSRMRVAFAADDAFTLTCAQTVPTTPGDEASMVRWCGPAELGREYWMATLLAPRSVDATVRLAPHATGTRIEMSSDDWSSAVSLGNELQLLNVDQ